MSRKACADLNRALPVQKNIDYYERISTQNDYADNYGDNRKTPWYGKITQKWGEFYNRLGSEDKITVEQQRTFLNQNYKRKEAERVMLVSQIQAMIESNPNVAPHFWKLVEAEMNVLDSKLMRQRFPEYEIVTFPNPEGQMVPHLNTLPPPFLRVIHAELYDWINGGKFFAKKSARLHNFQIELLTPRTVAKKDPTGLIFQTNAALEFWNQKAQSKSSNWIETSEDGKRPGVNDIANKIKELTDSFGTVPREEVWDMFFRFKRGEAFFKKGDNRLWVSTKWVQPRPGEAHRWVKSEDSIKLYEWTDELGKKSNVAFLSEKSGMFKQSQIEMLYNATDMLKNWYSAFFDNIESITKHQNARTKKINRIAKENGTQLLIDQVTELGIISDEVDIAGLTKVDKKNKFYMTRMYYQDMIPRLLDDALSSMLSKRDMLASKMMEYDPTVVHSEEEVGKQIQYEKRVNELNTDVYILNEKISQYNDGIFDLTHNEFIQARHLLKNFKRVTEMIHPEHARTDANVLPDYAETTMRTVQRNEVTLDFMEALATHGNDAKPGAVDYAINHYKSSFYFPDAKTTYAGFKTDAQTWANRLNALPIGRSITPQELSSFMRSVSSFMIFNTLNGPLQGLTNYSNFMLKVHDIGVDRMTNFMDEFDKNPEYWFKKAEKAGVTQFTSFIEGHVQKNLREDEIQVYKGEIDKLNKEIRDSERTKNYKRLIVLKKRLQGIKSKRVRNVTSKAAQWAITRRLAHNKNEKRWTKTMKTTVGQFYGQFPSIAETEENLRVISFGIGVQNYLERNPGTTADDQGAIDAGIEYAHRTDFGLSHQHVGMAFRGPIGGFLTRMRIWHVQRFGNDINVYKQAIRENTRPEMVERIAGTGEFRVNSSWLKRAGRSGMGMLNMFGGLVMPPGTLATNQRLDKKFTAKARSHLWGHGIATLMMDFGIYALAPPLAGTWMSTAVHVARAGWYRNPMGRGLNGFGSSYHSLVVGGIHLLGILASGGFDEREYTPEQFFAKYAYHIPFLGLGASVLMDLALYVAHNHRLDKARGKFNYLIDRPKKIRNIVSPGGKTPWALWDMLEEAGVIDKDAEVLESTYRR